MTVIARSIYRSRAFRAGSVVAMDMLHRIIMSRAIESTAHAEQASALVLAPHPDDETLGCGATILRKARAGTPVFVVFATDGENSHKSARITPQELARVRRDEARQACALLGVPSDRLRLLGYPDGGLSSRIDAIADDIATILKGCKPDEVLAPSAFDGHPDHRALNAAARQAMTLSGTPARLLEYPVWFWDLKSWVDRDARPWVQASQLLVRPLRKLLLQERPLTVSAIPFQEQKRRALMAYRSQTTNLFGEPGWPVLDDRFLEHFFHSVELFFPLSSIGGGGRQ